MDQLSWAPSPTPPSTSGEVVFAGERRDFSRLVRRGAALELVTLGFYRFWLVTDIRRHLWSNTLIDGDSLEYTGRARELLIGFLIALAILAPFWLLYFLAGVEAERFQAFASTPLFILLYAFGQFAIYRARRYRLTRTIWRGVRFWMDGSGWAYALRAMGWTALMMLTFGLVLPWRQAALERYKMRHSHYGNLQGRFEGKGWELVKEIWWMWPILPIAMVLFPLFPFLYAQYKAKEMRWWVSGIRFGEVRVESALSDRAFYGLYWKFIGWSILLLMGLAACIALASALVASLSGASFEEIIGPDGASGSVLLMVLTGIGYLAFALALNVALRIYLQRDLWAKVSASITVHDIGAAADVAARGGPASALGEGFADGLDVAGF